MFGISWPWTLGTSLILLAVWSFVCFAYGNAHGSNAAALAAIEQRTLATNAKVDAQKPKDESEIAAKQQAVDNALDKANDILAKMHCPATKQVADILNGVR